MWYTSRIMFLQRLICFLALSSLVSLVALGLFTALEGVVLVLWPFGVTPYTHPVLWKCAGFGCLASLAGMILPYLLARLIETIAPRRVA